VSYRPELRQVAKRAQSFIAATLVIVQPVISALILMPQPAHADVTSGDVVFLQAHASSTAPTTYTITKRSSSGTLTPLKTTNGRVGDGQVQPDVSRDGSRVAFVEAYPCVEDPSTYRATVRMMNSDGSRDTSLTSPSCPQHPGYGSSGELVEDTSPRWSPDGTQVAFSHQDSILMSPGTHYSNVISKVDVGSAVKTPLTETGQEYDGPSWSPADSNGNYRIAYDSFDSTTGQFRLYVMDADGANSHLVDSSSTDSDLKPVWSHDGSRIYFMSSGGAFGNFWYYDSTDSFATATHATRHQISGATNPDSSGFDLSADDSTLYFVQGYPDAYSGCAQLASMSTSGGTPTQLTDTTCNQGVEIVSNRSPSFADNAWPTATTKNLVALGDSVAAGEGINYGWQWNGSGWVQNGPSDPSWQDTTNASGDNYQQCHQSGKSYADQFALYGDNYKVYNMACTGATALENVQSGSATLNGGVLDQEKFNSASQPDPAGGGSPVPAQLGGLCSGCATSNLNFDGHDPDVVTLTIGANDLDFKGWVSKCYDPRELASCVSTTNTSKLDDQLATEHTNLGLALAELNSRASTVFHKTLRVLVTNYYNPFPDVDNSTCVDLHGSIGVGVDTAEQAWLKSGLAQLNVNIEDQVNYAKLHDANLNISLVDISNLMSDHKWCSQDPWAYGPSIDFPFNGENFLANDNPAPFHPTPEGQHAIYQAVKAAIGGMSSPISSSADTYVDSGHATTNYGTANPLWATSSGTRSLLRFNTNVAVPAGNVVTGATLKFYVTNNAATSGGFEVHPEDDSWSESTATWNNQPTWNSAVLATSGTPTSGTWVSIALPASAINVSGNTSLGLRYTASGSNAQLASREDSAHKPQLTIDTAATLVPSADTYIDSNHTGSNYGTVNPLWATSSNTRAFVRFSTNGAAPSGATITGAFLKIYVTNNAVATGGFEVHSEADTWAEGSTTWSNQPTWDSNIIATSATPSSGSWITISLPTSAINVTGSTSLGLRYTASGSNAQFSSREDTTHQPQLTLAWQ
jgi:lysophospholipase L1-like esterase